MDPLRHEFRPGFFGPEDAEAMNALRDLLLAADRVTASYPIGWTNTPEGKTFLWCDLPTTPPAETPQQPATYAILCPSGPGSSAVGSDGCCQTYYAAGQPQAGGQFIQWTYYSACTAEAVNPYAIEATCLLDNPTIIWVGASGGPLCAGSDVTGSGVRFAATFSSGTGAFAGADGACEYATLSANGYSISYASADGTLRLSGSFVWCCADAGPVLLFLGTVTGTQGTAGFDCGCVTTYRGCTDPSSGTTSQAAGAVVYANNRLASETLTLTCGCGTLTIDITSGACPSPPPPSPYCFPDNDCAGSPATVACTVTNKVGCYTSLPNSFNIYATPSADYCVYTNSSLTGTICAANPAGAALSPASVSGGVPRGLVLTFPVSALSALNNGAGFGTFAADSFTCDPFSAVFTVDDGKGNTCTVTAIGI